MEIGSIFEIQPENLFVNEKDTEIRFPFMKDNDWKVDYFNTGRAAIEAFISTCEHVTRVWLPAFICTSVIDAVKRTKKEICYYKINRSLQPDIKYLEKCDLQQGDIFYVMQYFGLSMSTDFLQYIEFQRKNKVLIFEDITMSLLSDIKKNFAVGDYILGSVRKWDAVPDGAFLATKTDLPVMKKENASYDYTLYYFAAQVMKSIYLTNSLEYDKEQFLSFSNRGIESLFSDYSIRNMSGISYRLFHKNWKEVFVKRRENYDMLYELLKEIPQVQILNKCEEGKIPLGMFILVEDRDGLLNYLILNAVYCNVHWRQNEGTELFEETAYLSKHCITIPCDQRYSEKEMRYICDVIKKFWENKDEQSI